MASRASSRSNFRIRCAQRARRIAGPFFERAPRIRFRSVPSVLPDREAYCSTLEATVTIKELIALLQKENPDALVIKYKDGGTTVTSGIERLAPVSGKLAQGLQDQPAILIE